MGRAEVRVENWPRLLDDFVLARQNLSFAWGTNDCATFAAAWVALCTGQTLFEATYGDAAGAAAEMAERGGLESATTAVLGEPLESPLSAQRGDVGLVDIDGRESLVVVTGSLVVGPGKDGLHAARLDVLTRVWRV